MTNDKNVAIEMPEIEEKTLKKFHVYRKVVSEFHFEVLAVDKYEAQEIAENKTSIEEYTDYAGMDYEETYIDNQEYHSAIEGQGLSSAWIDDSSEDFVVDAGDDITLYKFENESCNSRN